MTKEEQIDWHKIVQDILDDIENTQLLSGKKISSKSREYQLQMRADFVCFAEEEIEDADQIVRPFSHFKKVNVIEFKSLHETINSKIFRNYCSRALAIESGGSENYEGQTTLTILTSRKPIALLKQEKYRFEELTPWKYKCSWFGLEIFIMIQNQMRDLRLGEAMALLQVVEGDKDKQSQVWHSTLNQDLKNAEQVKKVINIISGGMFMNVIQEAETRGKVEGKLEGKIEGENLTKEKVAINMLREGFEIALVAKLSELSEEEVQKLKAQL